MTQKKALLVALKLKTGVNKLYYVEGENSNQIQTDIRISIGIGKET